MRTAIVHLSELARRGGLSLRARDHVGGTVDEIRAAMRERFPAPTYSIGIELRRDGRYTVRVEQAFVCEMRDGAPVAVPRKKRRRK